MRKVAAAALAVPVLAIVYLPILARRSMAARAALIGTVGIVFIVAALSLSRPVATLATPPSAPISGVADAAFRSIEASTGLHAAVDITFSEAMDTRSVEASLSVDPAVRVRASWNAARTVLTVRPASAWAAGTYHTITVAPGALAATGRPMANAIHAAFVTRAATTGRIVATDALGTATATTTAFRITFDHPVATATLATHLSISPAVEGALVADSVQAGVPAAVGTAFTFTPAGPLQPATTYRISVNGLVDADGGAVADVATSAIQTATAPSVIRFRPVNGSTKIDRTADLSIRFSEPMNHRATTAAISVKVDGKAVKGAIHYAENNTVLVFDPSSALPAGKSVTITVGATAASGRGVPLSTTRSATFKTAPKAATVAKTSTTTKSTSTSGGKAVGGGSWGAVETYYLRLMNCTRTGGWVTSSGSCSSPGGRAVAPLKLDSGISSRVSRPYAKKLAVNNLCTHFSGGNPGNRLSAAGYTSYIWAENLGCRSGNPYSAVLGSHLYFQSEKSYSGGHYVNLMNSKYDRVGIGVWVSGGRVRLVVDFYHPR